MKSFETQADEFDKHLRAITVAIQTGKLLDAESGIEHLCKIAPNEEEIRFSLADVRIALGNFAGALKAVEEVPAKFKESQTYQSKYASYKKQIEEEASKSFSKSTSLVFNPFVANTVVYPGLKVVIVDSISQIMDYYGLKNPGKILDDVDKVVFEEDAHERARRDAEVLTTFAANSSNSALELGTSSGVGTYKLASNLRPDKIVHTVNILPEQFTGDCELITHLMTKDEIGRYYRDLNVKNVEQIYANTLTWTIPAHIKNLSLVFIDAAHDTDAVYKDSLLTWERLLPGGYMIWHDFTPIFRQKYGWIDASMAGVTKFLTSQHLETEVVNLKYSWMGILRKPLCTRST